jgi:hypothetical protein
MNHDFNTFQGMLMLEMWLPIYIWKSLSLLLIVALLWKVNGGNVHPSRFCSATTSCRRKKVRFFQMLFLGHYWPAWLQYCNCLLSLLNQNRDLYCIQKCNTGSQALQVLLSCSSLFLKQLHECYICIVVLFLINFVRPFFPQFWL